MGKKIVVANLKMSMNTSDINIYLKMHNITDINIDNFDYRHQGFRGLDKYIEDIKKAKVQENV